MNKNDQTGLLVGFLACVNQLLLHTAGEDLSEAVDCKSNEEHSLA